VTTGPNGKLYQAAAPAARAADSGLAASGAASGPTPAAGRAQHYEAQLGIEVEDDDALSAATGRAQTIARDLGGYVEATDFTSGSGGTASLVVRVPTGKVQEAIARLTALGRITSQHVQIQDLQDELDQLDRQLATLRGQIAHVATLLADPGLTPERRAQLLARREQLQNALRNARRQRVDTAGQAALATIQLTLATKAQSTTPSPASRWRRSLDEAGRILAWEGIALLYAVAVTAPFGLVGGLLWLGARARRRGGERRLLARTP
jgi:hypothetical protein